MDEIVLSPFSDLLGIEIARTDQGSAVLRMTTDARLLNRSGTIHGGAIFTLADAAMGAAVKTLGGANAAVVTRNAAIEFAAPAQGELLECRAEVGRREGRGCEVSAIVRDGDRIVATARSAYVLLEKG